MHAHPVATSKSSGLRHWVARLVLVVACAGTVATSEVTSPPIETEHLGQPFSLTRDVPTATRHLRVRISAKDSDERVWGDAVAEITARWRPTDPTRTDRPSLRVRLSDANDDNPGAPPTSEETQVLGEPGTPVLVTAAAPPLVGCNLDEKCEWDLLLDFELLGEIGEGEVELEWKVVATASVAENSDLPDGFAVSILEP